MVCNRISWRGPRFLASAAACQLAAIAAPALAQSADDNAVTEAQDAFGFATGIETVGLYSSTSVRGFSPIAANNIRVEGLYFDQQGYLVYSAFDSSSIEVGINARGYVLPNPSGVVDFKLRRPGGSTALSLTVGVDPIRSPYISATASAGGGPGQPGVAARAAYYPGGRNVQGAENRNLTAGLAGFLPISSQIDLTVFAEIEEYQEQSSPIYFTSGPFLPPRVPRGRFRGQPWAFYEYQTTNGGLIIDWRLGEESLVRAGLFRSTYDLRSGSYDLITRIDPAGFGRRVMYAFAPEHDESYSGEIQYRRIAETGRLRLTGTASLRGRSVARDQGGTATANLGRVDANALAPSPQPRFDFGSGTKDRVDQLGLGAHVRVEWNRRLDLSLGIQHTRYEKTVSDDADTATAVSSPWLYQVLAAWAFSPALVAYASASNGLEESGVAPAQAVNRGAVLPATITEQRELGVRATLGSMTLTVSGFDLSRPYANLDDDDVFTFVGRIRHRGVELSLAGQPVPGLTLIAGALYLDAQVTQSLGPVSRTDRAVGQPRYRLLLSGNYRVPGHNWLTIDGSVSFQGDRVAKRDPEVPVPDYALFNIGARVQLRPDLIARAELRNVFDTYGYTVSSTSAFGYVAGRTLRFALTWNL